MININNSIFLLNKLSDNFTDLDYLEQIYKKVRVQETVQFNGKGYKRIYPKNNKFHKYPYHFYMFSNDIYEGAMLTNNKWDELVNVSCNYKAVINNN